ncbi:MAG: GNAT family N-acetyltransferase [Streptococcaceae bacterium]|jgi:predicted acetyltransferase|nr:GNAT family N-acetyltransferase [Streptococcaceae bacterium]
MNSEKRITAGYGKERMDLVQYAFNKSGEVWENAFQHYLKHTVSFTDFTNGKLTSQVSVIPFELNLHGVPFKSIGIGYVASYPEVRGNGAMHRIFEEIEAYEQEEGIILSLLDPFSYGFYGRFGYVHAYNRLKMTWANQDFPSFPISDYSVERLSFEEALPIIQQLHRDANGTKKGSMVRSEWWWEYWHLKRVPHEKIAVAFDEYHVAKAYVRYSTNFPTLTIHEWIGENIQSLNALGRFIQSHSSSVENFVWISPEENPEDVLAFQMMAEKRNVKLEVLPYMQVKINDWHVFLRQYPWKRDVSHFVFQLDGKSFEMGEAENKVEVSISKENFTKLLFSKTSVKQLVFQEEIVFSSRKGMEELEHALHSEAKALLDEF